MPDKKSEVNKHILILRANVLEAPRGYFDDSLESSEEEFDTENLDSGIEDDEDFEIDIEDADIEDMDDIETGELGNDPEEELFDDAERATPHQADIEFSINKGGNIEYSIDLGNLSFGAKIVNDRLHALTSMAEFLIEKQARFLRSPDIRAAYENLRSFKQKDFSNYQNYKKEAYWSSRVVNNKNILAPFSRRLIPISDIFDDQWETVVILKKAIDYHMDKYLSNPLSASDQSKILYYVTGQKYTVDKVKRIWGKLKLFYEKKNWPEIRLEGGQGTRYRHDEDYLREIAKHVLCQRESVIDTYEPE